MKSKLLNQFFKKAFYGFLLQCLLVNFTFAANEAKQIQNVNQVTVNLNLQQAQLSDVFRAIESQTNFVFSYIAEDLNQQYLVSKKSRNVVLSDFLLEISRDARLKFKQVNNNINVSTRRFEEKAEKIEVIIQTRKVSGTVVSDENNEGLPGVNVIEKGTTNGIVTDIDGKYALEVSEGAVLVFSSVGYTTEEVQVGSRSVIDLTMKTDVQQLDELVVIGYGTSKKKDLTGSIVNVQAEEVEKYKPSSVSEILRSTVPGLQVGYATDARGVADFNVRADASLKADIDNDGDREEERAANRPLIVLDGVIFLGDLAEINPNDIESVDVLKDASSAAIYGSQASNGVVIITTKKGQAGKPRISVSSRVGLVTGARRIETFKGGNEVLNWLTDMNESINSLSEAPWSVFDRYRDVPAEFQDDWLQANGIAGETDEAVIDGVWVDNFGFWEIEKENFNNGVVYDWQDFLFQTGLRQDYDVSVSGRSDKVSYYYSLGYSDRESVQMWESFKTVTSRLNLDVQVADFMNVGVNANFAFQDEGREPIGSGGYRTLSPYDQPWANGAPRTPQNLNDQSAGSNRANPYIEPSWNTRQHDRYMLNPTVFARVDLPLGFNFKIDYTPRIDIRKRYDFDSGNNPERAVGEARRRENQVFSWQVNNILSWDKSFGEHRFSLTGLYNAERNQRWFTDSRNNNFSPTESLGYHGMGFGLNPSISSNDETNSRTAIMGRINYAYGDRYNISASIRRDGYSRFGLQNLHGNFPSLSAAWTITNESFMSGAPAWINYLKLRASWGVNGNSSGLEEYNAFARLSNNLYLNYDGGYVATPYVEITRIANPNLGWERNEAFNFGLDFGLIDNRLSGSFDVYRSETKNLLLDQKLPDLTGLPSAKTNIGNLQNTGFELGLNSTNISRGSFIWTSTFNVTYAINKILTLGNDPVETVDANGNTTFAEPDDLQNGWFIGENKDIIWDWELDGVYQIGEESEAAEYGLFPGDFRYVDQDNDGDIDVDDRVFLGLRNSPWYLTFRNDMEFKGFDLGLVFLAKLNYKGGTNYPFNNRQEYIKNRNWFNLPYWTPNNPINDAARINSISFGNNVWISKSYLRLQNVSLGYTLPPSILDRLRFERVRLALNIENAAVWTEWHIGDPESEREMPRIYSFSLDFTF
ncbi:MAG: SusC/RagA family TonB-linked outer membrane protein [Candidatus Cyclobacteriaceae bacterium M3_2C_046]